jgi:hypothetical protein
LKTPDVGKPGTDHGFEVSLGQRDLAQPQAQPAGIRSNTVEQTKRQKKIYLFSFGGSFYLGEIP